MKADYKNWMPKGMVTGAGCGMIASLVLFLILGVSPIVPEGSAKRVIGIVLLILMQAFVQKLKDMGYDDVKLIDTTSGMFMNKWESIWMGLSGSAILMGRK